MLDWVTWKLYLVIGLVTGGLFFLGGRFAGPQLTDLVQQFEDNAIGAGMSQGLTSLFAEPIRIALEGNVFVSIIVGMVWPLTYFVLLMYVLVVVYGIVVPGVQQAGGTISN